jgi:hypothetical protein
MSQPRDGVRIVCDLRIGLRRHRHGEVRCRLTVGKPRQRIAERTINGLLRAIRGWPRAPPSRTMVDMCIICADFDRGALKVDEARRALREMISTLDAGHARQVAEKLDEAAQEDHEPPSTT